MTHRKNPFTDGHSDQVTLEHCSVLQERLGAVLDKAYPHQDLGAIVTNNINPEILKEDILTLFSEPAFLALFDTEMGKGVLIGAFIQEFVMNQEDEE